MAAAGILSHSNLTAGITEKWGKLGENVGMGPDNATVWNAFLHSAEHYANLVDPSYNRVGVGVAFGHGLEWTCHKFMELLGGPPPPPPPPPPPTTTTAAARHLPARDHRFRLELGLGHRLAGHDHHRRAGHHRRRDRIRRRIDHHQRRAQAAGRAATAGQLPARRRRAGRAAPALDLTPTAPPSAGHGTLGGRRGAGRSWARPSRRTS